MLLRVRPSAAWRGLSCRVIDGRLCRPQVQARTFVANAEPGPVNEVEVPWFQRWRLPIAGALAVPVLGGFTYWVLYSPMLGAADVTIDIQPITEEVFDKHDNLFVFFLDASEDIVERKEDIQRTIRTLMGEKSLKRLRFYYNVKKEGDPPVPDSNESAAGTPLKEGSRPLQAVMYKGQRKSVLLVGEEVPLKRVVDFFSLLSEDLPKSLQELEIPRVSGLSFDEHVVNVSTPAVPILVQMYEDSCFLCFLMRPFVNSLARLLKSNGVPVVLKRLNIEKNDFPDRCPVARGTPTFVLFRGPELPPDKWEEFKPKDLVEKIAKVFPRQAQSIFEQMDDLQAMVSRRFQLFTQMIMWTMELQNLERQIGEAVHRVGHGAGKPSPLGQDDDSAFNALVSEMMAKDMRRTDGIVENLAFLQKEIDEAEHDSMLLGHMLGEAVLRCEKAEEEELRSRARSRR